MRLPESLKTLTLLALLCAAFAIVAGAACASVTAPIGPCTYVAKPLTDSTSVITYETLPCFDVAAGRVVVRKR